MAKLLLDSGAEVDKTNKLGATPLYVASQNGHIDAARLHWRKARRSTGRLMAVYTAVHHLRERPRRRQAVAGQRRGGRQGDGEKCDASDHRLYGRSRRRGATVVR